MWVTRWAGVTLRPLCPYNLEMLAQWHLLLQRMGPLDAQLCAAITGQVLVALTGQVPVAHRGRCHHGAGACGPYGAGAITGQMPSWGRCHHGAGACGPQVPATDTRQAFCTAGKESTCLFACHVGRVVVSGRFLCLSCSHQRTFVLEVMGRHCGYVRVATSARPLESPAPHRADAARWSPRSPMRIRPGGLRAVAPGGSLTRPMLLRTGTSPW